MSKFNEHSDRLVAMVSEGLTLTDACKNAGVPFDTARNWITRGRRDPSGEYGAFAVALDRARMAQAPAKDDHEEPGPVEREVRTLIAGQELKGETAVTAAQALALARKVDSLSAMTGGSAGLALASVSRRLEDCVAQLRLPRHDWVDDLREQVQRRRQAAAEAYERAQTNGANLNNEAKGENE
jgi:hypothetical protein